MKDIRDWGPLVFLTPHRFIERGEWLEQIDIEFWSDEFKWRPDEGWWIFGDWAQAPSKTLTTDRGDCEDYALVVASWALETGRDDVQLHWCWEGLWPPYPTHVIVSDSERVYSSGTIYDSLDEFYHETRWTHCVTRSLN